MIRKTFFSEPTEVMILDVCGACNAQCPFCPRIYMPEARAKGFMSDEVFETALSEAKNFGIKDIRLYATAEPTLHPKIDTFIDRLKSEDFHVTVSTNASTLHKHFTSLQHVDMLQYSIEGWNRESYERYRFPLKFDTVLSNISGFWTNMAALTKRPRIRCNFLVTKNVDFYSYFSCWADYVDEINVSPLMNTTRFKDGRFISEVNPVISDEYFDYDIDLSKKCSYPFNTVSVTFDGKLALCCNDFSAELELGTIKDGIKNWQKNKILDAVRKQFNSSSNKHICRDCNFFCVPKAHVNNYITEMVRSLPEVYARKVICSSGYFTT